MLVFYAGWRLAGLVAGILAATVLSFVALRHERRQGRQMYPFPDPVRQSVTYRRAFSRISLVWGVYLVGRSVLRLVPRSGSSVEAFLAVNIVTGVPLTTLLLGWSIWYGVRFFRRSEEWGAAIRALDAAATAN